MPPSPLPPPSTTETADGWVKSIDPRTGRPFYANRITRVTQWEAPPGWPEEQTSSGRQKQASSSKHDDVAVSVDSNLPAGWEEMTDPTSGRKFYVDHERKITTWEKPKVTGKVSSSANLNPSSIDNVSDTNNNAWLAEEEAAALAAGYQFNSDLYGSSTNTEDVLTTTPTPDFVVRTIGDKERLDCPQCLLPFNFASRRRHHCRLCGDVFCDDCSSHRVALPLDGPEFEKPVRVCDLCNKDVDRGNYFSMRRYLPPLQLHNPGSPNPPSSGEIAGSATHVVAALGALTSDLESILQDSSSFEEKITIPAPVLIPAICRHIDRSVTQEHAIHALSTLLTIGSLVGTDSFARAVYSCEMKADGLNEKSVIESILQLLERNSSSSQVISSQVFAARALFYLTDPKIITRMLSGEDSTSSSSNGGAAEFYAEIANQNENSKLSEPVLVKEIDEVTIASKLDVHRALRNVLDHSSASGTPSLQRWAAASIRHLIIEDKRRVIQNSSYNSFIPQISSTGGILILCSMMGTSDSDTRTHATAALASIVVSARAIDNHRKAQSNKRLDRVLISSIVDADGCGSSLSLIMQSKDDTVARMGVSFAASLISPLLVPIIVKNNPISNDNRAYHNAALALANNDKCLNALVQIVQNNGSRSTELIRAAVETLASIAIACCSKSNDPMHISNVDTAIAKLESMNISEAILKVLRSSQSILSQDSPSAQLREAAGILTCALCYTTQETMNALLSKRSISTLLSVASDESMQRPSQLRCQKALRCLPLLEAVSAILVRNGKGTGSNDQPSDLDNLLEAIEGGIIPLVSRLMLAKIDFNSEKSVGDISLKTVSCLIIDSIFSIAFYDETLIGGSRLYGAILADAETGYRGRGNLISTTISLLHASTLHIQQQGGGINWFGDVRTESDDTLITLEESALLAVGSICGAVSSVRARNPMYINEIDDQDTDAVIMAPKRFTEHRHDACIASCGILFDGIDSSIFATMLVGALGERAILPTLRLLAALCSNGPEDLYPKLANNGILIPISDLLRNAMNGDKFTIFASLTLFRYCGPYVTADTNESGGSSLGCVRDVIRIAAGVIKGDDVNESTKSSLLFKTKFLSMLEALSGNASLWNAITSEALPALAVFLCLNTSYNNDYLRCQSIISVLRIVQGIIPLPSNAMSADQCGVVSAIADLYNIENIGTSKMSDESYHLHLVGLGVLRILSGYSSIRRGDGKGSVGMVNSGVFNAVCSSLNQSVKSLDSPFVGPIAHVGIELLMEILSDLSDESDMTDIQKATLASSIIDSILSETNFIKVLVATMLSRQQSDSQTGTELRVESKYGSGLICPDTQCAGHPTTYDAAIECLLTIALQCATPGTSSAGERFWDVFLLKQDMLTSPDKTAADVATACSHLLNVSYKVINDEDETSQTRSLLALESRLMNGLKQSLEMAPNNDNTRALLVEYQVTVLCIRLCHNRSKTVQKDASELIDLIGTRFPELLTSLSRDRLSLSTMFDMIHHNQSVEKFSKILFGMAEDNTLGRQVIEHDMRKHAIESLTRGCQLSNEPTVDELRIASFNMGCLVSILQRDNGSDRPSSSSQDIIFEKGEVRQLSSSLASAISFLISIRVQIGSDEFHGAKLSNSDGLQSDPEIILLCALASHNEAIPALCENGAIPALTAIANYGDVSALTGIYEASKSKADIVIKYEGHLAASRVLSEHEDISDEVKLLCILILTELCKDSQQRRNIIGESCSTCINGCINYIKFEENCGSNEEIKNEVNNDSTQVSNTYIVRAIFKFLNEMTLLRQTRKLILDSPSLVTSIIALEQKCLDDETKFVIIRFLSFVAPFLEPQDGSQVVELFVSILRESSSCISGIKKQKQPSNGKSASKNLLLALIVSGLESLLDIIDNLKEFIGVLTEACSKRVDSLSTAGNYINVSFVKDSGAFIMSCTSLFLTLTGSKDGRDSLFTPEVFQLLLHISLLNPRAVPVEANQEMWSAAQVQNLQCLAILTRFHINDEVTTYAYWEEQISNAEEKSGSLLKPATKKNIFVNLATEIATKRELGQHFIHMLDEIYRDSSSHTLAKIAAEKILRFLV